MQTFKEILESELNIEKLTPIQFDGIIRAMRKATSQAIDEAAKEAKYGSDYEPTWLENTEVVDRASILKVKELKIKHMGNLRQSKTDEEWAELEEQSSKGLSQLSIDKKRDELAERHALKIFGSSVPYPEIKRMLLEFLNEANRLNP